jgi:SAM-dependent methyltransferase
VAKKTTTKRIVPLSKSVLSRARVERVVQRIATRGRIQLPAVPGLVDEYVKLCSEVFSASGRGFSAVEREQARAVILSTLTEAFRRSQRSKVELSFEAEQARPLGFSIEEDTRTIAQAYERWIGSTEGPLFGAHPDAWIIAALYDVKQPENYPILDFGAGTGRNAFALSRRGYPVDAVEITPKFIEMLEEASRAESLSLRVISDDVFSERQQLRQDYMLLFASEVVPDFRVTADLRKLFELAEQVLAPSGKLIFNVHLCAQGYEPEKAARELAQQCYSCIFTPTEVVKAAAGFSFHLVGNVSVHDFEKANCPKETWPPVPWYENWTQGLDVYAIDVEQCPVELRWLTFEKRAKENLLPLTPKQLAISPTRARRFDQAALRKAIVRRLFRRMNGSGTLIFPALPGFAETYVEMGKALFHAFGRTVSTEQSSALLKQFETVLGAAFASSQRSNVVFTYEAPSGKDIKYTITADPVPLAEAYEQWHETLHEAIFGEYPDARLLTLLEECQIDPSGPVLDLGAGLGRNAFALARRGHPVDAVELSPRFANVISRETLRLQLPIRVFERDLFSGFAGLRDDYCLVVASGLVGDFRDLAQLYGLFELVWSVLKPEGLFLLNLHFVQEHYECDEIDKQWAQHCCAMFYNSFEVVAAVESGAFDIIAADDVYLFERTHVPEEFWPVTPAFVEWATGCHLYAVDEKQSPVALKWLVLKKKSR